MAHSFVVFVDENRKYHVSEIEPAVEGVSSMVDQLNADNGFDVSYWCCSQQSVESPPPGVSFCS